MAEHLSPRMLESYRQRTLPVAELPQADEHLAECATCRAQLGELAATSTLAAFFRRDAEQFAEHLDYHQLEACAQGRLAAAEKQSVEQHLRECALCQREAEDLRTFAVGFDGQSFTRLAPEMPASFWQRLIVRLRKFTFALPVWQLAGMAAAIVLVVTAATLFVKQRERNLNVAVVPTPSPITTPATIPNSTPLPPPSPVLPPVLSSDPPPQVDLALHTERLKIPAEIAGLAPRAGNLMGSGSHDETVVLAAPAATFINAEKPTLRWKPLAGAARYSVRVTNQSFDQVANADNLTATQWTLPEPLVRGQKYSWQVTAYRDGKETLSPSANFLVLDKTKASALAAAQKNFGANHLAMGVLYAEAGLLDDAAREFRAELKTGPQSVKARKLLQNLRAQRQFISPHPQPK